MTRPDFDYEAHAKRIRECGRTCRCDFARRGELCNFGEDKAQRIKDDRGNVDALYLWVGSILVAFGALSILWPLLVWALLAACFLMATVAVVCVVVGTRKQAPEVDR